MIERITDLDPNIPVTVIYGKNSWMKQITIDEFDRARRGKGITRVKVSVKKIKICLISN